MTVYLDQKFIRHIKDTVNVVFELGSRDCIDGIAIGNHFSCNVHSFECNPSSIELCKENIKLHDIGKRITLCEKALWDKETKISFFPVVNGNTGASSCFKFDSSYHYERLNQIELEVETTTLDKYCEQNNIEKIDYLCADLQGAALKAFQGGVRILSKTKYLTCEMERKQIYHGQALFDEINDFLKEKGFILLEEIPTNEFFSDFFYLNTKI